MVRLFIGVIAWLALLAPAYAANCGVGQVNPVCQCGDTVVGAYVMPASLTCSSGHGLRVASGGNLNCNGKSIAGVRAPETYGVYFSGVTGAKARKCVVTGWDRGIRFLDADDNLFRASTSALNGNVALHTGYGVDIAGTSSGNQLINVKVWGNADEGVHIGSGTADNRITASEVCGNFRENIYILAGRDHVVSDTRAGHDCFGQVSGGNSVYLKDSTHVYFLRNIFAKRQVHVTGDSSGTLFIGNVYIGTTYKEDCYVPTGACPSDTITIP